MNEKQYANFSSDKTRETKKRQHFLTAFAIKLLKKPKQKSQKCIENDRCEFKWSCYFVALLQHQIQQFNK